MTQRWIFLSEMRWIKKKEPSKGKIMELPSDFSLWCFISELGKDIDWGSSYIPIKKHAAIALIKGFVGNKTKLFSEIEKIDKDLEIGLVCMEL